MSSPPSQTPDQITEADFRTLSRRQWLSMLPLFAVSGALVVPQVRDSLVSAGAIAVDSASRWCFPSGRLAPTYTDRELTPLVQFPVNRIGEVGPEFDATSWSLIVEGAVTKPGRYTLEDIRTLPRVTQNTLHTCIEGWQVIGKFSGVRLGDFLKHVGADLTAKFVEVSCWDDYYTSLDLESCLHPQSLLCDQMYGNPLTMEHGAPLRLHLPTKLGYKSAKHLFSLRVSHVLGRQRGYWEDQGYPWYGGL